MVIGHDIGGRAMAGGFAAIGLCMAPLAAYATPVQIQKPGTEIGGSAVTAQTLTPPASVSLMGGSAAPVAREGFDPSGISPDHPSRIFAPGLLQPRGQLSAGSLSPRVSGQPLSGDCLNCSTIGGGSGGGGSGGVVISPPTPATQPASLPVCKTGEQLVVLGGTPRCV